MIKALAVGVNVWGADQRLVRRSTAGRGLIGVINVILDVALPKADTLDLEAETVEPAALARAVAHRAEAAARALPHAHAGELLLKCGAAEGTSVVLRLPAARVATPGPPEFSSAFL